MQIGVWSLERSLPLHLCGLSAILSGVVLFYNKQFAYECLFYWGLAGALQSFLTPELNLGKSNLILYLDYFISHAGIIFSALYFASSPMRFENLFAFIFNFFGSIISSVILFSLSSTIFVISKGEISSIPSSL